MHRSTCTIAFVACALTCISDSNKPGPKRKLDAGDLEELTQEPTYEFQLSDPIDTTETLESPTTKPTAQTPDERESETESSSPESSPPIDDFPTRYPTIKNAITDSHNSVVRFMWSGAPTSDSIRINAGLNKTARVRAAFDLDSDFQSPIYSDFVDTQANEAAYVYIKQSGLKPAKRYHYALEVDGQLDLTQTGTFETLADGPMSYNFTMSGDAEPYADAPVFTAMLEERATFGLTAGDFAYGDLNTSSVVAYRSLFESQLTPPRQAALYRSYPFVYMWDDHDYGDNNCDKSHIGRRAARVAYHEVIPHYPLADHRDNHPRCDLSDGRGCITIAQSFPVGRTYFIMTDLRSERDDRHDQDDNDKSMMGEWQKDWFLSELVFAAEHYSIIFWVNSVPWISPDNESNDDWGGYATERREIQEFVEDNEISNVIILSGDAHMLALDDGSNSNPLGTDLPGMPVFHAASLYRGGSIKGGPYSHGAFENPNPDYGQYGVISITDEARGDVCVQFEGKRLEPEANSTETLIDWKKCYPAVIAPTLDQIVE